MTMNCIKCGSELLPGKNFCIRCGMPVNANNTAYNNAYSPASMPSNNMPPNQPPKKKSKVWIPIVVVLGVLFIAIAGFFAIIAAIKNSNKTSNSNSSIAVSLPTTTNVPSSTEPSNSPGTNASTRTVMIYMVASNLESTAERVKGHASNDIDEILAADIPEGVNVILECGGTKEWRNEAVPDGKVTRFKVVDHKLVALQDLGVASMTAKGDLADFIKYSKANYPAEKYVLVLWDHGGGSPLSFGSDELSNVGDGFTDVELGEELSAGGTHFETVVFNACLMCSIEVAMSLREYTDYMVGAESTIITPDIYYTNWLSLLGDPHSNYYEKIVEDYQRVVEEYGYTSSMSVIRMDRILDVYKAYVNYVTDLNEALDNGGYATYVQARECSGTFEGSDSVDLVTLANAFPTDSSTALINAVTNATVYTYSTINFGHGITAYSPYLIYDTDENGNESASIYDYTKGRKSFDGLGYDAVVANFYDKFMSILCAKQFPTYAANQAWYIANAGNSTPVNTDLNIHVANNGKWDYVPLSEDDWNIINTVRMNLFMKYREGYTLYLGSEYKKVVDSSNNLVFVIPKTWPVINNHFVTLYCVDNSSNSTTGEWTKTYSVCARVNGQDALLSVFVNDSTYQNGVIQGYYPFDFNTWSYVDKQLTSISSTDKIILINRWLESDGTYSYTTNGSEFTKSQCTFGYRNISPDMSKIESVSAFYSIYDVYGKRYTTDTYILKERDNNN